MSCASTLLPLNCVGFDQVYNLLAAAGKKGYMNNGLEPDAPIDNPVDSAAAKIGEQLPRGRSKTPKRNVSISTSTQNE